jgi:hypothetical protein
MNSIIRALSDNSLRYAGVDYARQLAAIYFDYTPKNRKARDGAHEATRLLRTCHRRGD